jgi:hypothetical protein
MRYVELPAVLQQQQRVVSIDALHGLNMFCIMGLEGAMWALADMTYDKGTLLSGVGSLLGDQFIHVYWEGLRFYDFVFPLFISVTAFRSRCPCHAPSNATERRTCIAGFCAAR